MNHYSLPKYLLIISIIVVCAFYALPNLFGEDPAVQISPPYARDIKLTPAVQEKALATLKEANITPLRTEMDANAKQLLLRFTDIDTQLKAYSLLKDALKEYVVAQNLASATPAWLTAIGAQPMYLGLDLRGGVHFLMQVDMPTAIQQDEEQYIDEFRTLFRNEKLRYKGLNRVVETGLSGIEISFAEMAVREQAKKLIAKQYGAELLLVDKDKVDEYILRLTFSEMALREKKKGAVEQNITTLNNRINELGVAEPVIQQQGDDRIVVQLPGVQDTARAKEILGATATLEFRLTEGDYQQWAEAEKTGRAPVNARLYHRRDGNPVLLKRSVIVTGDQISNAVATTDQRTGEPVTAVSLNNKGAKRMDDATKANVGKPMAVVFIEYKVETKTVNGKSVTERHKIEEVINVATIQERFSSRFQITGLGANEARNLALLLRAGALKAPMEVVEERTVGPSLGKENIRLGFISSVFGFLGVILIMWLRYSTFGLVANFALLMNVIILIALMSMLQATLTLPGIAGIALTLGMAVDANVLIYERMREEVVNGNSPQASIYAGFEKAFITIFDSNLTTLLAAVMLFSFGSGPVRGFAVTLSLGIITSMFTAIWVSRAVINFFYGDKKLAHLPV